MAVNVERYPARVPWTRGRFASWLITTDHKRIGILYIATSLFFFVAGGILALLMRAQLATPNEHFITKDRYNELFTMHGTTMVFLVVVPILAGFGNYLDPADDRRARRRVPAAERTLVLAVPARRGRPVRELVRVGRRAEERAGRATCRCPAQVAREQVRTCGSCRSTSSRSRR